MPIQDYAAPNTMLELVQPVTLVDRRWFVLHTRPRQEKQVRDLLTEVGGEPFLPLYRRVRTSGKRKISSELPLFPSYVFFRGIVDQAYAADRLGRIVQIIQVTDQTRIDVELSQIRHALAHNVSLDPYPYLRPGVDVEVRSGPLQGLRGVVESRAKMDRLFLGVEMLGRAVSMEIDAALLDII